MISGAGESVRLLPNIGIFHFLTLLCFICNIFLTFELVLTHLASFTNDKQFIFFFNKTEDFLMAKPVCVNDFEELARKTLPKYAYDFYASGANEEFTLKENCEAYKRYIT